MGYMLQIDSRGAMKQYSGSLSLTSTFLIWMTLECLQSTLASDTSRDRRKENCQEILKEKTHRTYGMQLKRTGTQVCGISLMLNQIIQKRQSILVSFQLSLWNDVF